MCKKMKNTPLISIVIPVHNAEKFLAQTLRSVLLQDVQEIEVLAVLNNSTDKSEEILNEFALRDDRVKIFTQNEGRVGAARNVGIKNAQGKYISFLDADDYYANEIFQKLYTTMESNNVEFCSFALQIVSTNTVYNENNENFFKLKLDGVIPSYEVYQSKNFQDVTVWNKIYSLSFLIENKILFNEYRYSEDIDFILRCYLYAKNTYFMNVKLINYRKHTSSSTKKVHLQLLKRIEDFYDMYVELYDEVVQSGKMHDFANIFINSMNNLFAFLRNKSCPSQYEARAKLIEKGHILCTLVKVSLNTIQAKKFYLNLKQGNKYFFDIVDNYDRILLEPIVEKSIPITMLLTADTTCAVVVTIQSIIESSDVNKKYHLIILYTEITSTIRFNLLQMAKGIENLELFFYDLGKFKEYWFPEEFTLEKQFEIKKHLEILVPVIFGNYRKILFLQEDIILKKDLSEIFEADECDSAIKIISTEKFNNQKIENSILIYDIEKTKKNIIPNILSKINSRDNNANQSIIYEMLIDQLNTELLVVDNLIEKQYTNQDKNKKTDKYWSLAMQTPFYEILLAKQLKN